MKQELPEETPINKKVVSELLKKSGIKDMDLASIREVVKLIGDIEKATGAEFIRMEMGVPGLKPSKIGVAAEIEALKKGVASTYPSIEGIPELKQEASRFIKLFMDIDIAPDFITPTVGSMQGGLAAFMVASRRDFKKNTTLFIDPGFPVQKQQHRELAIPFVAFDLFQHRGKKLEEKLESILQANPAIATITYSNPNNPTWMCLRESELEIIGKIASKYDLMIIEDLAYFGMDFRHDYSKPGKPPFQPTVAKYTDNYILLISSSKIFSYAGQRIALVAVSPQLYHKQFPALKRFYSSEFPGHSLVYGTLYATSSGTCHSAQYALAAMLKAANDGKYDFLAEVRAYGELAREMKRIFLKNGFKLVYDKDIDEELADGFYFTVCYPGLNSSELLEHLLYYGMSAISLVITGSERNEGIRACVSLVRPDQLPEMEKRLQQFNKDHNG
jgi:aspartate/methionine/tyrosine aminotransferase